MTHLRALIAGLMALMLTACAPATLDATYVGDAKTGAYTKTPADWETVTIRNDEPFAVRAFWEPGSTQADLLTPGNKVTGVLVRRAPMSEEEGDLSLLSRSIVFNLDQAITDESARIIEPETDVDLGDLFSERLVYEIDTPDGTVKVLQVHAINSIKGQVYGIAVGCSTSCFDANRAEINRIVYEFEVTE